MNNLEMEELLYKHKKQIKKLQRRINVLKNMIMITLELVKPMAEAKLGELHKAEAEEELREEDEDTTH